MAHAVLDLGAAQPAPVTTIGNPLQGNGMSLEQLITELRAQLLGRVDVEDARLRLWINWAYLDMVTSLRLDEVQGSLNIPLVTGQHLYRLPPSVFALTYVGLVRQSPFQPIEEDVEPLEKTDQDAFRRRPHREGWPREFFRFGPLPGVLVVWPEPDEAGALLVDFRVRPRPLVEEQDCPILGEEWHEGLLIAARQKALVGLQEWEAATEVLNEYIAFVRRKLDPAAVEEDTKVVRTSVPRNSRMMKRRRRGGSWFDGME